MLFVVKTDTAIKTEHLDVVIEDPETALTLDTVCREQQREWFAKLINTFKHRIFLTEWWVTDQYIPCRRFVRKEILTAAQRTVNYGVPCPA